jgi:hypothetical protein
MQVCARTHTQWQGHNDAIIKAFYIKYCKILNKVIQEAKNSIITDLQPNLILKEKQNGIQYNRRLGKYM